MFVCVSFFLTCVFVLVFVYMGVYVIYLIQGMYNEYRHSVAILLLMSQDE